jgi:hypothetical protein
MMTRRLGSSMPNSPIRIYQIITAVFLIITIALLALVFFMVSKRATITVIAKEDNKNVQVNLTVGSKADENNGLPGVVTSTVFYFSKKYSPEGTKTVEGTAVGEVTIYNKSGAPITLIPKTRFITSDGILFRLKNRTTIADGSSTIAEVYADKPGKASDIGASDFTLPALPADKQKVIYAASTKPMSGGSSQVGTISQDDVLKAKSEYKEDVVNEFLDKNSDKFAGQKVLVTVAEQKLESSETLGKETSGFVLSGTSTLVLVKYQPDDLLHAINQELNSKLDPEADKVISSKSEPQVSISSYDLKSGTAELAVTESMVVTVDASLKKLSAQNFLGMNKKEIEASILSLDHVAGVEVRFSPSWMRSAPQSADKIKVLVKNIQ